jgi:hypothetical protein
MWVAHPEAHFGRRAVDPIGLDPLCDVADAVVLTFAPKHFYHLSALLQLLELDRARCPCTRRRFGVNDLSPLITPKTQRDELLKVLRTLLSCGWQWSHSETFEEELRHITDRPFPRIPVTRMWQVWDLISDAVQSHPRLPPIDMAPVRERWARYARIAVDEAAQRGPDTPEPAQLERLGASLQRMQAMGYQGHANAGLHLLADRFVRVVELLCGPLRNVPFKRIWLLDAFVFTAFRHNLPVVFDTAHILVEQRVEPSANDPTHYVLRPYTAAELMQLFGTTFLLDGPQHPTTAVHALRRRIEQMLPLHRAYEDTELEAAVRPYFVTDTPQRWRPRPLPDGRRFVSSTFKAATRPVTLHQHIIRHIEDRDLYEDGVVPPLEDKHPIACGLQALSLLAATAEPQQQEGVAPAHHDPGLVVGDIAELEEAALGGEALPFGEGGLGGIGEVLEPVMDQQPES